MEASLLPGQFRSQTPYKPLRIVARIFILQIFYIILLVGFIGITTALIEGEQFWINTQYKAIFHLDQFLTTKLSFIRIGGLSLCSVIMGLLMEPVIGRSRECLDYSITLYTLHWLVSLFINGWPILQKSLLFVIISSIIQIVITVQIGRWRCQQIELLPIPLSAGPESIEGKRNISQRITPFVRLKFLLPWINNRISFLLTRLSWREQPSNPLYPSSS